jgi:exoribonuclease II
MEPGRIVEYIDQQRIFCAVVLEVQDQRVRLLNENGRELSQKIVRLSHVSADKIDASQIRDRMVDELKAYAQRRNTLSRSIDIREIWEVLHCYEEWIDLESMTGFCFLDTPTSDHEAAVIRAFFENRIYFKFDNASFYPHPESVVENNIARMEAESRQENIVTSGAAWFAAVMKNEQPPSSEYVDIAVEMLQQYYLFGKDAPNASSARAMLKKAGADNQELIFSAMVKTGKWSRDENLDLYRFGIRLGFSAPVMEKTAQIEPLPESLRNEPGRVDLTDMQLVTIDGYGTMDFDDALSVEKKGKNFRIGVHVADVGAQVEKGGIIDREIIGRGTSIYMPDQKIPMIPPELAENTCSLIQGETRPAISVFFTVTHNAEVLDSEIFPSLIRVDRQITYNDADHMIGDDEQLGILHAIAVNFRKMRLEQGGLQILLPDINIRVFPGGEVSVKTGNRESPSRILVAEMMIMANWLFARFLADNNMAAIFRAQPDPKGRLYGSAEEGTLFQNWMQRRLLSRVVLGPDPGPHASLGLDAYTTATSPIRKYFDLATQRQIRACLGLEEPYAAEEIEWLLQVLKEPLTHAAIVQARRHRYWLLRYLEGKIGTRAEAIILDKRKDGYIILIPDYLLECKVSVSAQMNLKPKDLVQVTFQHVDAMRDKLVVFFG